MPGQPTTQRKIFDVCQVEPLMCAIDARLAADGFSEELRHYIRLACGEAAVNAVFHGSRRNVWKTVDVQYWASPEQFSIRFADEGAGFEHEGVPDTSRPDNIGAFSGRGITLMRSYAEVCRFEENGSVVVLSWSRTWTPD